MNRDQLESFVRIAELGSFSKAAVYLHVTQPALSRQIHQLEHGLNASLFSRSGRGVELTESGHLFYEHARVILARMKQASKELNALEIEPIGRVSFGLPPSIAPILAPVLLDEFHPRYPLVRLYVTEGVSSDLLEWLVGGRIDLAIVYTSAVGQPKNLISETLLEDDLFVIGNVESPITNRRRVSFQMLETVPLLLPSLRSDLRILINTIAAEENVALSVAFEFDSAQLIKEFVRGRSMHSILPHFIVRGDIMAGRIAGTPLDVPQGTHSLGLNLISINPLSLASRSLAHMVRLKMRSLVRRPIKSNPRRTQ